MQIKSKVINFFHDKETSLCLDLSVILQFMQPIAMPVKHFPMFEVPIIR